MTHGTLPLEILEDLGFDPDLDFVPEFENLERKFIWTQLTHGGSR